MKLTRRVAIGLQRWTNSEKLMSMQNEIIVNELYWLKWPHDNENNKQN